MSLLKKKLSEFAAGSFCLYIDAKFFEVFINSLFLLHKSSSCNLEGVWTGLDIDVSGNLRQRFKPDKNENEMSTDLDFDLDKL